MFSFMLSANEVEALYSCYCDSVYTHSSSDLEAWTKRIQPSCVCDQIPRKSGILVYIVSSDLFLLWAFFSITMKIFVNEINYIYG